jgi:hypothetical protein
MVVGQVDEELRLPINMDLLIKMLGEELQLHHEGPCQRIP